MLVLEGLDRNKNIGHALKKVTRGKVTGEKVTGEKVTGETVRKHLKHIFEKLGVSSKLDLASQYLRYLLDTWP